MTYPIMFLIAGVNGSGKSTLTKTIVKRHPSMKVIDPDAIAKDITGSFATIDTEAFNAGKTALRMVQDCIDHKQSFMVESTLSGRTYLRYLKAAKGAGFETILIYLCLHSYELSAQRVASRVAKGGHDIPLADIKRRYAKSFGNIPPHREHCDTAYIVDNSTQYTLIAHYNGLQCHKDSDVPEFMRQYLA